MSERVRIDADTAEALAQRIMSFAGELCDERNKFIAYYNQYSEFWQDNKAQVFQKNLQDIDLQLIKALQAFYDYGNQLHEKIQKLRS